MAAAIGVPAADVYEFRWLEPGQSKTCQGRTVTNVHSALHRMRKRYHELRSQVFRAVNVFGGVIVERVK